MTRSRSPVRGRQRRRSYSRSLSRSLSSASRSSMESIPHTVTKIAVQNLSLNVNEMHLLEIFSSFGKVGKITDLQVVKSDAACKTQSATIEYLNSVEAEKAIKVMNSGYIDGLQVSVMLVKEEEIVKVEPRKKSRSRSPVGKRRRFASRSRSPFRRRSPRRSPVGRRRFSRSPPRRRISRSPPRRKFSRSPPRRNYSRSPSPRRRVSRSPPRRRYSRSPPRAVQPPSSPINTVTSKSTSRAPRRRFE